MRLYATGSNAWHQLQPQLDVADIELDPDDISSFTCVLQDDSPVDRIRTFLSYTVVHLQNGQDRVAGVVPKDHEKLRVADQEAYANFVEASNGIVVVPQDSQNQTLHQHPSLRDLLSHNAPSHTFSLPATTTQLLAYETGFAALSATGQVWTWGDERYAACLGREPSDKSPAILPGLVPNLQDLPTGPITKLAAGTYLLAALTAGNDLYIWGHAGRCPPHFPAGQPLTDEPTPMVLDNEKDIVDVAIGEKHMLVLTCDGEVWGTGDNSRGQLGLSLPPGVEVVEGCWVRIRVEEVLGEGERVVGVAAGGRCSFLIVE